MKTFKEFKDLGISTFPLRDGSYVTKWKQYQERFPTDAEIAEWEAYGYDVGIVTGGVSGNLYVCDLDEKYCIDEKPLINQLHEVVSQQDDSILPRLVVSATRSGGYHLIYRVDGDIGGNEKFASRFATPMELQEDSNSKVRVLLESRGEKGMIHQYLLVDLE